MTDREPLRVGPLVMRWRAENWADLSLVRGGFIRLTRREHPWSTEWHLELMFIGADHDALHEGLSDAIETAWDLLERTGYLAQYRSRRRLLARECERRASYWSAAAARCRLRGLEHGNARTIGIETATVAEFDREGAKCDARANGYARRAERLRNG